MDPESEEIPAVEVNFASRFINLANVLGTGDWARKNWAEECSSNIDTGFNGSGLCSFSWLIKYDEYLGIFYPRTKLFKTKEGELGFAFWNQQGRVSVTSTVMPIWVSDSFKPVRARLIE